MRKLLLNAAVLLGMLIPATGVNAQEVPAAPVDSAVRVGHLPNGMTYYIRHNEMPKGQADFFIAQKVGSILEEENQRGLAHFLEHMCFNGTQNFPGNSLIDWLETIGVKFGQNLNAYTSIDETVYNISSVPVQRTGVIDSCLLILHDWADGLLLDPEEIEKERGVIHQEWRRSNVGQMRILENLLPVIYPDNKYGKRLPIGTMEVVDNFPPKALRDYYEEWYRPDQQGIIVVGDIDPDYIEAKIKEIFEPIQMPDTVQERVYLDVQDTPGTIYAIGKDKEMAYPIAMMMFKLKEQLLPRQYRSTLAYFPVAYMKDIITKMLNQRLSDMAKKPDCPFAQASVELGDFFIASTKDALMLEVVGKGNDLRPAFEAAYRELLRAARGGFTQGEFDRAKADYVSGFEKQYEQRNGRTNTSYAREYAANFTKGDPIPGIKYELDQAKRFSQMLPLQGINQLLPELIKDDNRVFLAMTPENDTYHTPTQDEIAAVITAVEAEDIEGYKDEMKSEPLVPELAPAVQATVSHNAQWDATELTYPNGIKIILKPTKFKDGEILFYASAIGGLSATNADDASTMFLPLSLMRYGLGTYTNSDLEKFLQGKNTKLSFNFDDYDRLIIGSTTPKNLKTLMELIHMAFGDLRLYEDDYAGMQGMFEAILANQESTPDYKSEAGAAKSLYKIADRMVPTTAAVKEAKRDVSESLAHEMLANPAEYTFAFVGDINIDSITALCNQYIGNLVTPRIAPVPYKVNPDYEPYTGANETDETMVMETPQTYVTITLSANIPYTAENRLASSVAGQILSNRLLKKIREEMGAVYSIGARASLHRTGEQNFMIKIPFPMKPELKDEVLGHIKDMVFDMSQNISDDEFNPIKEFMIKSAKEDLEKNNAWAGAIAGTAINGVDVFNGAEELASKLTAADVKNLMKKVLEQNNYRVYVLAPESK
ncbi:MAG: insulinase family protein [Bacteroidales bacterium]|nr:insulinase family protein [Bacteroidales bacterium]